MLIATLEIAVTKFFSAFNATISREFSLPAFVVSSVGVSYTLSTPVASLRITQSPRNHPIAMKFPFTHSTFPPNRSLSRYTCRTVHVVTSNSNIILSSTPHPRGSLALVKI